ncbi:FAD/NAD(P)-binding protein [Amycolatopsis oliviviridis]|uniref:FAD-dependent urate hydroxylase HpyO/Asp monooxygenase CreE-like FAD/NAD(P)-binding domain-containing protein n=1 Tax=Amycolatopsis oliviviridis TaxID=1471590 RepID=A0ABQ3MB08_9PSEU|nr:FAD/NAD(P)-binding protein [Amycolatopsis oliviviridis]GHH38140.1 hypothetical protein GCM10017790_83470 [Amycolatopsis oliviviridis]
MTVICVIGAGPRGTSVLERVCANARDRVVVHVVDPYPPGPGRVWRTDQPEHLLMNTVAGQVTLFTDETVPCAGPRLPGPSLAQWAGIDPDSYGSRALYGRYLTWFFHRLRRHRLVEVVVHRDTAVALGPRGVELASGSRVTGVDAVVLALGHEGANQHEDGHLPPGNAADADLTGVRPGEPVLLRGLGLTFFDYLSLFTVGRGGRFENGRYLPSGREPRLYAVSRRGVPHHARGVNQKGTAGRHLPAFLTPERVAALPRKAGFRRDIWPLIDREVRGVYYRGLLSTRLSRWQLEKFSESYADSYGDEGTLSRYRLPSRLRWDWDRIGNPPVPGPGSAHRPWLAEYLARDVARAKRGNVRDPLKAALDVLRDLRNEIRLAVDHGGVSGDSYRDEVAAWYTPLNAFLSIGPPHGRIEEMLALLSAGVLQVLAPGARVRRVAAGYAADASSWTGHDVVATTLIEARMPEVDLRATVNPLLTAMRRAGQCRPYRIGDYETGGLEVTRSPFRVVDAAGRAHPRWFAFGVPTEHVHWATAVGARPWSASVTLLDADAIARAALAGRGDQCSS